MSNKFNMDDEKWINSIKESLSDYSVSPSKDGWERISSSLAKTESPRLKTYKNIIIGAIASIAALFILFFTINNSNDNRTDYISEHIDKNESTSIISDESKSTIEYNNDNINKVDASIINRKKNIYNNIDSIAPIGMIAQKEEVDQKKENTEIADKVQNIEKEREEEDRKDINDDKKMTWEEYLKKEEKTNKLKVLKKKENNKTLLAIAAGSNSFSSSSFNNPYKMEYDERYFSNSISAYYTPYAEYSHNQPLTFSVMVGKNIGKSLTIETGLSYTLMSSKIKGLKIVGKEVKQTLNYLGIPIKLNWNFINKNRYSIYTGAGGFIERSIYAAIDGERVDVDKWQGGILFNAGAQFKFNENIALYVEPGLTYYIGMRENGSIGKMENLIDIKSIRSENPLGFSLSAGFRFSF